MIVANTIYRDLVRSIPNEDSFMGSEQIRFLQPQQAQATGRKRWPGCFGGLSCFNKQKGRKRIVPASRVTESNLFSNLPNATQPTGLPNQATGGPFSLYAPPSSPASFSQSPIPSTIQSPNNFLSSNSPQHPSSTMFVTGPYANETQLVSPPVFSTYTTEPSTAPFTPPPESSHLTTPSSPDVPYARFLSSSSITGTYADSGPGCFNGLQTGGGTKTRQDTNFFCPETFAQFYLDQSSSHAGGRLSISREADAYNNSNGGNGNYNRQSSKSYKADSEEVEAYRASFGFSADDIISTSHYVEIVDVMEESFSMAPFSSNKRIEDNISSGLEKGVEKRDNFSTVQLKEAGQDNAMAHSENPGLSSVLADQVPHKRLEDASGVHLPISHVVSDSEGIYSMMGTSRSGRKHKFGSSNSDAEIEYRRGRSLREGRNKRNN